MKTTIRLTVIAIFLIGIFFNTFQTETAEAQHGYVMIGNPEDIAEAIHNLEPDVSVVNTVDVRIVNPDEIGYYVDYYTD